MSVTDAIRDKLKLVQAMETPGLKYEHHPDWDRLLPYFQELEDFRRTQRRKLPRPVCFLLGVVSAVGVLAPVIAHLVPK